MRSPLRIAQAELEQVVTQAVEQYMYEVKRIRRVMLQAAVRDTYQAEGRPVPVGEEMEAHIDVLETLFDAGQDDPDKVLQLIDEMDDPSIGIPVLGRSHHRQKRGRNRRKRSSG
jgi:hypothetical protein